MPVVSFENSLDGCRNLHCQAVQCGVVGTVPVVAVGLCPRCPRCSPAFPSSLCSLQCSWWSTGSSAWLGKAGWGAEKAKDGFICTAAITQAV